MQALPEMIDEHIIIDISIFGYHLTFARAESKCIFIRFVKKC